MPEHPLIGNHLTDGSVSIERMTEDQESPLPAIAMRVLADNLKILLEYYKIKGGKPGTAVALEEASGVGNSTISRYILRQSSANVSDLSLIASAYDLPVWQLLYPNLDPDSPPVVWTQQAADEQAKLILEAALKLLQDGNNPHGNTDSSDAGTVGGRPADRQVSGTGARHKKRTKT